MYSMFDKQPSCTSRKKGFRQTLCFLNIFVVVVVVVVETGYFVIMCEITRNVVTR